MFWPLLDIVSKNVIENTVYTPCIHSQSHMVNQLPLTSYLPDVWPDVISTGGAVSPQNRMLTVALSSWLNRAHKGIYYKHAFPTKG